MIRPYTFEEFFADCNNHRDKFGHLCVIDKETKDQLIIYFDGTDGVFVPYCSYGEAWFSFEDFLTDFTWADGTPCGVEEEV